MPLVNSFFETNARGEFSLFDLSLTMLNPQLAPDVRTIRRLASEAQRFDQWMAATAYFHELRHYHDLVGSPAGIAIFLETTQLVDELLVALRENSGSNLVPILQRVPASPPARRYQEHRDFLSVALGEGFVPASEADAVAAGYEVRKFNSASLGVHTKYPMVPIPDRDPFTGEPRERLFPLGLRALMEHTATELQIMLSVVGAGEDPYATHDRARGKRFLDAHAKLLRGGFVPYYLARQVAHYHLITLDRTCPVTDLRFLAPLGSLVPFVQAALDLGGYAPIRSGRGVAWEFEHPGLAFFHLLEGWKGGAGSFESALAAADQAVSRLMGLPWREFLQRYVTQMNRAPWALFPPKFAPEAARSPLVTNIRHAVLEDHIAIMESKATDLRPWVDPVAYLKALEHLPMPPVLFVGAGAGIASSKKSAIFVAWAILLEALDGLMEAGIVDCPVKGRMQPLGRMIEFPDPLETSENTNCEPFIAAGRCGTYAGAFTSGQPRFCPFAQVINRMLRSENGRQMIELQFEEQRDAPSH